MSRLEMVEQLKQAKYLTLLSDGTTDSSVSEQEIIYVRYCTEGNIKVQFLGLQQVERANAEGITQAIMETVEQQGDMSREEWTRKLVGFGSDGASVMVGKKGGVAAHLKKLQPCLQSVHCYAHRLELAFKDAMKTIPIYIRVNDLLQGLYKFYHQSSLARSMLRESFAHLNLKMVVPTRIGGTRWLPHTLRALTNLWSGYPAIVEHMQQVMAAPSSHNLSGDRQAKAKHYVKLLCNKEVIYVAHILHDAIAILSKLSTDLQRSVCSVGDVYQSMMVAVEALNKYSSKAGPKESLVLSCEDFHGHQLQGSHNMNFDKLRCDVMTSLKDKLLGRFDDVNEGILRSVHIANLSLWPDKDESVDFGDEEVKLLVENYAPVLTASGIERSDIELEWTNLKSLVYGCNGISGDVSQLTWPKINRKFKATCSNILALIDLTLTLPAHSADCERGFSHLKQIKSDWRSRLTCESLTDLMRIQLYSPAIDQFDPTDAINLWIRSGLRSRRPLSKKHSKARQDSEADVNDEFESGEDLPDHESDECVVATDSDESDIQNSDPLTL